MATEPGHGPDAALRIVDDLAASGQLAASYLLPSVRGELLARLHRYPEAAAEFDAAAAMAANEPERDVLVGKAAAARGSV